MNQKKAKILIITFVTLASIIIISINWLYANFGNLSLDEIVFHLKVPMKGTSTDMVWKYIKPMLMIFQPLFLKRKSNLIKAVIPIGILLIK